VLSSFYFDCEQEDRYEIGTGSDGHDLGE